MEVKANANGGGKALEELLGLQVGVTGSPSSTFQIRVDFLDTAASSNLLGELVIFPFVQDGLPHYAVGQIALVGAEGSGKTYCNELEIKAVFRRTGNQTYEPDMLGTAPPLGTPVYLVNNEVLRELLRSYQKSGLFYLGYLNDGKTKLPLWFRHFGSGEGGAGGTYNLGIFGKAGSGKSVLAKMIFLAYARFSQMAILVIDPQGEFSKAIQGKPMGDFYLPMGKILKRFGRELGKELMCLEMISALVDQRGGFERLLFGATLDGQRRVATLSEVLEWLWGRKSKDRPILVLDLSGREFKGTSWNDVLQRLVIERLIGEIASVSESSFMEGERNLNTLILVEEAHRFVSNSDEEDLGRSLVETVRATRKRGVGWLFVGNTLAGLPQDLLREINLFFLGFGLGFGEDAMFVWNLISPERPEMRMYQGFADPHSNPSRRQYPFMTIGPVSPLGFTGTPFFFNAFNNPEEFLRANGLSG